MGKQNRRADPSPLAEEAFEAGVAFDVRHFAGAA